MSYTCTCYYYYYESDCTQAMPAGHSSDMRRQPESLDYIATMRYINYLDLYLSYWLQWFKRVRRTFVF